MYCSNCGYRTTGHFCPNCGKQLVFISHPEHTSVPPRENNLGLAIASLVLGIIAIISFSSPVPVFSIIGIVFGSKTIKSGMGRTGLILSIVGLVGALVFWAFIFFFVTRPAVYI